MLNLHARLQQAREAFWVLPATAIVVAAAGGLLIPRLDAGAALPDWLAMTGPDDTARTMLGAIVTLGVSVAGVSFSVLAVALVLASQQLSPRILRSFQRQPLNQAVLAGLLGTATYALFVLGAVGDDSGAPVPELAVTIAMILAAASLVLFAVFLHHAVRSLNASVVIRRIAAEGHESIACPYPAGAGEPPEDPASADRAAERSRDTAAQVVEIRAPRAGYVASVDGAAVVEWAERNDAFVEQEKAVGSFAVTGTVLARVHCGDDVDTGPVGEAFLLGEERVVDGDIAFPVRQLSDIALKGLSPGVNDPTTAENAMDSIADTLVRFGNRDGIHPLRVDGAGRPRLRALVPRLDELVRLGFDQVRRDAADRPSFATRLLELLADIRDAIPDGAQCGEIERQGELIAATAEARADAEEDQRLVAEAHERLRERAAVPQRV